MKKLFFILFLITSFFLNSKVIMAFDFSGNTKGFYSTIADNIDKMESNLYKIDIVGEEGTMKKINDLVGNQCLKENLSIEEINYVLNEGKLDLIFNKIDEECKKGLTNEYILNLVDSISSLDKEYKNQAKQKTNQIFNLGSTGIYADGIEANSPFDLIIDLQNIDSILFTQESDVYEGNTDYDLGGAILSLLNNADNNNQSELTKLNNDLINLYNSNKEFEEIKNYDNKNSNNIYSNFICSIENSNSGLSKESLDFLKSDEIINNKNKEETSSGNIIENKSKKELTKKAIELPESNYSKVTDNNQFPCNDFICIDIQFITYNHNLLGGAFQTPSIEYLLNRSNDHLKKFTNTSLIGSKMTLNNFELGLKNFGLPDIFHIGVQITKKPVPILNIQKKEKVDESIYKTENQLKFYYEAYGLDYNRRNDLSIFKKVDIDKQIALNSSLLLNSEYLEKIPDFNNIVRSKLNEKDLMNRIIENEVKTGIMDDFEMQFKEIQSFNSTIKEYIINMEQIYSNMLKIPSDVKAN
ncbi:MAG: hypothetical protein PHI37_02545 [Candidatus Gracilibacteria bacterium]|nr:hypothetical protein [Candidatus Gracilibacteria bacterium]